MKTKSHIISLVVGTSSSPFSYSSKGCWKIEFDKKKLSFPFFKRFNKGIDCSVLSNLYGQMRQFLILFQKKRRQCTVQPCKTLKFILHLSTPFCIFTRVFCGKFLMNTKIFNLCMNTMILMILLCIAFVIYMKKMKSK